ncbi:MAG TPA: MaoC family dehydratase [Pseudomonas sp.]|jgi:acyl dehydratase|nr:MaoC family dehydratase [Pseudomonas sp.]
MTVVFHNIEELLAAEGRELGHTEWLDMTQERVNLFAEATGDHQWIHVDPERAARTPFGGCIAHGYLTLSLASQFMDQLMRVENLVMGVNYGCDKVRFPAPVKVGSRVRGQAVVLTAERTGDAVQLALRVAVEVEGQEKPGCVAEILARIVFMPSR